MKKIIGILIILLGAAIVFVLVKGSIEKTERAECEKWQAEAKEYVNYFLADWQRQQCEHYKIDIRIKEATATPVTPRAVEEIVGHDGIASWYDYGLPGDPDYSKTHSTAASRKYRRGTMIRVCTTELETQRCVVARVNDYGPDAAKFPGRVVDLSSHAFAELFPLGQGVGKVIIIEN